MPDEQTNTEQQDAIDNAKAIETEDVDVNGQKATVEVLENGDLRINAPEGLTPESREQFIADLKERSKTVGSYYRKLQELKEQASDPDFIAFKEARAKGDPAPGKVDDPGTDATKPKQLWERAGLDNPDKLTDWIIDNPGKHSELLQEITREQASASVKESLDTERKETLRKAQEQTLAQDIVSAGYDPEDVKIFAEFKGMNYDASAFEYYRLSHGRKEDPVLKARMESQANQIHFVEGSGRSRHIGDVTKETIRHMSDADLKALQKQAMAIASPN